MSKSHTGWCFTGTMIVLTTAALILVMSPISAAPPGPGPGKPGGRNGPPPGQVPPRVRPGHDAGPNGPPPGLRPHKPAVPSILRKPHFWHPQYAPAYVNRVGPRIGYRYYLGGTDYVTVPVITSGGQETTEESTAPVAAGEQEESGTGGRYVEMQELVDLIYQWRTLNESPRVLERFADASLTDSVAQQIKEINERFDQTTRDAMLALAAGRSAENEIRTAGMQLGKLMELTDSLASASAKPTTTAP